MKWEKRWLAVYCWLFHPIQTFQVRRMVKGKKQEFVGTLNGSPHIYVRAKLPDEF